MFYLLCSFTYAYGEGNYFPRKHPSIYFVHTWKKRHAFSRYLFCRQCWLILFFWYQACGWWRFLTCLCVCMRNAVPLGRYLSCRSSRIPAICAFSRYLWFSYYLLLDLLCVCMEETISTSAGRCLSLSTLCVHGGNPPCFSRYFILSLVLDNCRFFLFV